MPNDNANLGVDLVLGEDGELALSPSGDLAVTQDGRQAVAQDICHVLETLPGDLFAHPEFGAGLGRLLGESNRDQKERLLRAANDALLYHPSIASRLKMNTVTLDTENLDSGEWLLRLEAAPADASSASPRSLVFRIGLDGAVSLVQ